MRDFLAGGSDGLRNKLNYANDLAHGNLSALMNTENDTTNVATWDTNFAF